MILTSTHQNTHAAIQLTKLESAPILGIAGSRAIAWLSEQGIAVPETLFAASAIEGKGWIVRSGTNEVFIQSSSQSPLITELRSTLESSPTNVYEIPREDTAIQFGGAKALSLLAQTCGIDFRRIELNRVTYTRIAGVGCCILPETDQPACRFRIWFDPSFEDYLWHVLNEIANDLARN